MIYELAKKLKDAGFPQTVPYESQNFKIGDKNKIGGPYEMCAVPTLGELIEACGKDFRYLLNMTSPYDTFPKEVQWVTSSWKKNKYLRNKTIKPGWGSSPEEAVAHLWLALHSKSVT